MAELGPYSLNSIITGDARELARAIPDNSVDLIFTDPPYPREFLPLYGWLAETAARILKPNGTCLALTGKSHLPDVMNLMGEYLAYHWIFSVDQLGGQAAVIWPRNVSSLWRPILWYQKGDYLGARITDTLRSEANDKHYHKWGQELGFNVACLLRFPAVVTVDFFAGGGTVAAACKVLHRNYLAFEIDPATADKARQRVLLTQPPLFVAMPEQVGLWQEAANV